MRLSKSKRSILILTGFLLVTIAGFYIWVLSGLPGYSGKYMVAGIEGNIEIIRDENAIPHIFASNQNDLVFGLGYAMAEDRLWQMDLFVRVAKGRLSEIFGKRTLKADRFSKILGFEFKSTALVANLRQKEKTYLAAFVKGINHYITHHPNEVPIEFSILGYQPKIFSAEDIMALSFYKSYISNHNWKYELLRASAIEELGETLGRQLIPAVTFNGPYMAQPEVEKTNEGNATVIPYQVNNQQVEKQSSIRSLFNELLAMDTQVAELTGFKSNEIHSNFFVVSGSRSESGKPIFANDYHMPLLLPSLWYQVRLVNNGDDPFDAVGITMPGSPTILAGHNQAIAWGATTTGADTQDIYYEKLNPENSNEYLSKGHYVAFNTRQESIFYKENGELKKEVIQVKISRHGPIINSVVQDRDLSRPNKMHNIALQSISNPAAGQIGFAMDIYKAKDWVSFKNAIKQIRTPIWNWGYADKKGNIGLKINGKVPIRKQGLGLEPKNGWSDQFDWSGYVDFDALPEVYNPKEGFIVSANNEISNQMNSPQISSTIFQLPYRALRIEEMIRSKGKQSQKDIQQIQLDVKSKFAMKLRDEILAAISAGNVNNESINKTAQLLSRWDGNTTVKSVSTSIIQEVFVKLLTRTFANKISKPLFKQMIDYGNLNYIAAILLADMNTASLYHWFDDPATDKKESKQDTILASLNDAIESLTHTLGDNIEDWRWGKLHQTYFVHQMGKVAPFKWIWNIDPNEFPGDISTVNPGIFHQIDSKPYRVVHGASMRHVIDFGNPESSNLLITTGQSGRWLSKYYDDQAQIWHDGGYLTIAELSGHGSSTVTTFTPKLER